MSGRAISHRISGKPAVLPRVATDALDNGGAARQLSLTLTNLPEKRRVRRIPSMSGRTRFLAYLRGSDTRFAGLTDVAAGASTAAEQEVRSQ